jgi:hypothetical protein
MAMRYDWLYVLGCALVFCGATYFFLFVALLP